MNTVTLHGISVNQALIFKDQLLASGLQIDQDFVWRWSPPHWDPMDGNQTSWVSFEFRDPAHATFYQLKFSQDGA
jgi:hypothetical protein